MIDFFSEPMDVFSPTCFLQVWISISVTTIRNRKGWPRARMAITIGICIAMFGTAIILASYVVYQCLTAAVCSFILSA